MISDALAILRFITDPETRKTVKALASIRSREEFNWKRDVRRASAKFSAVEPFQVTSFANAVISDMKALEISPREIKKFRTVFDELIRNAFEHGCKEVKNCKVSINCTYSRWFIVLQVTDTGRGFDLSKAFGMCQ